ncbi:MAG: MFS transporter [Pseudomonadota bacterium]
MALLEYDINESKSITAIILVNVVGPAAYITQPGLVQGFVEQLSFTEQQAGFIAASEMGGVAITAIFFMFLTGVLNWRTAIAVASIVMFVGNGTSILVDDPVAFAIARGIVGVGEGVLISLGFTMLGLTRQTDRNFGYMVMWLLLFGAIFIALMPMIFAQLGMTGVLLVFMLMSIVPLLLRNNLPEQPPASAIAIENSNLSPPIIRTLAVFSVLLFFIGIGAIWAYLFLLGLRAEGSEQNVANTIMVAQFVGAAGAFFTATLADRFGRFIPILATLIVCILSQLLMTDGVVFAQYVSGVLLFNFCLNMAHPYLFALLSTLDRSGGIIRYAIAAQMLGIALGPSIAAAVIQNDDLGNVTSVSIVFLTLALVTLIPALRFTRRLPSEEALQAQ